MPVSIHFQPFSHVPVPQAPDFNCEHVPSSKTTSSVLLKLKLFSIELSRVNFGSCEPQPDKSSDTAVVAIDNELVIKSVKNKAASIYLFVI